MIDIKDLRIQAENAMKYGHGMPVKPAEMLELLYDIQSLKMEIRVITAEKNEQWQEIEDLRDEREKLIKVLESKRSAMTRQEYYDRLVRAASGKEDWGIMCDELFGEEISLQWNVELKPERGYAPGNLLIKVDLIDAHDEQSAADVAYSYLKEPDKWTTVDIFSKRVRSK